MKASIRFPSQGDGGSRRIAGYIAYYRAISDDNFASVTAVRALLGLTSPDHMP
ncbi:hypothetical protein N4G62_07375 [Sphingomonas sanguinis]|uniref:Uncharacterized protein n=1 Tax=Sphingomonas sanguinis TaxID=33051 RepID=A0ABU5LQ45_9SPHN|nr:hypothetical protein [Sphingomonas sanguinis]MDZ7281845.1 hypothetical protein [Sphingomonas sanguinis]